jgi:hypothetical protein
MYICKIILIYIYVYIYLFIFAHVRLHVYMLFIYKYTLPHMDPWNVNPHFTGQILHNKAHFGS